MKINILLPYKENFDENKASSVSITVRNNLVHTSYLKQIKVFGQNVKNPLFKENFVGLKYSLLSLQSKNKFLASKMIEIVNKDSDKKQLIEIHNRPYLIDQVAKGNKFPISLFFHNDPQTMKGSKSIKDRENILEKCTSIFCVSEYIKNKFLKGIKSNLQKIHVLHNGVERKLKKFPNKKKEILFVGRLVYEKGVDLYVEAIQSISSDYPDWSFHMIGSFRLGNNLNTNVYANRVRNKFNKVGAQAKFHGFKNQHFVEEKMKTASIIIIPSLWQEPFGLVAAEAMSNGICIVASEVGGIKEIVGKNGVLISDINVYKLRTNLKKLIENDNLRLDYQQKAWKNFKLSSAVSSKKLDEYRKITFQKHF